MPGLTDQDRSEQDLLGLAFYLEANQAATVLLRQRAGASAQPLGEPIQRDVRDVLARSLLRRHVFAVDARAVRLFVFGRELRGQLGVWIAPCLRCSVMRGAFTAVVE